MPHEILGQRFYNRSARPAWHGLGLNDEAYHSANDALVATGGSYNVSKFEAYALNPATGEHIPTGTYSVMREPIEEDNEWRMFGTQLVTDDFVVFTPQDFADMYDTNVTRDGAPAPVETWGTLGKGDRVFISTTLPNYGDIMGDETTYHMLMDLPIRPGLAATVAITPVRVVCQNTLMAALGNTVMSRRVSHAKGARAQLEAWMATLYLQGSQSAQQARSAMESLARIQVSDNQVRWIINNAYPLPSRPTASDSSRKPMSEREAKFERDLAKVEQHRETAVNLFNGQGFGSDTQAYVGTAFGIYNAVSELETWGGGVRKMGAFVADMMTGRRAERISRAYQLATQVDDYRDITDRELQRIDNAQLA